MQSKCVQCTNSTECKDAAHAGLALGANAVCNTSTHNCSCAIKDGGNVLTNPGFDTNTTGWKTGSGGAVTPGGGDAFFCNQSGSASITDFGGTGGLQQCAKLSGGPTFYFGASFFQNALSCSIAYFSNSACSGDNLQFDGFGTSSGTTGWGTVKRTSTAPSGATYALVECAQWDGMSTLVDQIYLNGSNDSF